MTRKHLLIVVAVAVLFSGSSPGQHFPHRTYTASDGLPGHEVEGVAQLGSGSLVFLTKLGVATYDGAVWSHERDCVPEGLSPWRLATGSADEVWVFAGRDCWSRETDGEGGVSWTRAASAPIESSLSGQFRVLDPDGEGGRLLIAALSGELHVFDGGGWTSVAVEAPVGGLSALVMLGNRCIVGSKAGLMEVDLTDGTGRLWDLQPPGGAIIGLTYDPREDCLWALGADRVISRIDAASGVEPSLGATAGFESSSPLFQGGNTGLERLKTRRAPIRDFPCAADLAGGLYFGDRFELFYYHPAIGFESLGVESGLTPGSVTCAFSDREGNTWLGSARGATKVSSRRVRSFDQTQGLYHDDVTAAIERVDGTVVLGHVGGITVMERPARTVPMPERDPEARVMGFANDGQGRLWVAMDRLGLGILRPDGELELELELEDESAVNILASQDGEWLWVAADRNLYRLQEGALHRVDLRGGPEKIQIRNLAPHPDEGVYLATAEAGVLLVSPSGTRQWISPDALTNNTFSVLHDSRGEVWAGTKRGLARLEGQGQLLLSGELGLGRPIYSLVEGPDRSLWVGTDTGVHRRGPRGLESFGIADGLAGEEANRASAFVTGDGRVWIGSNGGISVFDPRFEHDMACGPWITLETVETGESTYDLGQDNSIDHDERTLTFRFSAFSFVDETRLRFEARLEGWDESWREPTPIPERALQYTSLPAGDYRLHLRAVDARGRKSEVVSSGWLEIQGPIWTRPWFLVTAGLLLVLIVRSLVMLRLERQFGARLQQEVRKQTRELREMEREQERLLRIESIGVLAGGIAHDFNNLLTTVTGNASLLEEQEDLPGWKRDAIADIMAASSKAAGLASRLLTFSSGGSPIKETAHIGQVLRECVRFSLLGSNVDAHIEIPDDLYVTDVDVGQFSQVLNNLVINARQAMPAGGRITIEARNQESSTGAKEIAMTLTDEGPGIPAHDIERIFDPYFTTKADGHGLGLATARSIIQRHGGDLTVESPARGGARFRITLKADAGAAPSASAGTRLEGTPGDQLQANVLVMDDQEAVRTVTASILRKRGCVVTEASDGEEAVRLYEAAHMSETPFSAVVMDLTVSGGMGGVEATELIVSIDERARVVATSGYTEEGTMARYQEFGFIARLSKPFTSSELVRVVSLAVHGEQPLSDTE